MSDAWVRKASEKGTIFNMQREKETFMEAKKSFIDLGALKSRTQLVPHKNNSKVTTTIENPDPTVLMSILQTCMKLLRDQKTIEGLQELIDNCTSKEKSWPKQCVVNKVNKNKKRIGRDMRLTAQISEF